MMKQGKLRIPAGTLVGHLISMPWFTMTDAFIRPSVYLKVKATNLTTSADKGNFPCFITLIFPVIFFILIKLKILLFPIL